MFVATLRWIAVLPGAFIAGLVSATAIKYVFEFSWYMAGQNPNSPIGQLTSTVFVNGMGAAAIVYLGCRIAPSHQRAVAAVLGGLVVLVMATGTMQEIDQGRWWRVLGGISAVVGALIRVLIEWAEAKSLASTATS